MARIISTTFSSGEPTTDQGIRLVNEDMVIPLPRLDQWNHIEIAMQMAINGNQPMVSPVLGMGVCHGKVRPFKGGATTVTNFFGVYFDTMTYTVATPPYYAVTSWGVWQHGATIDGTGGSGACRMASLIGTTPGRTTVSIVIRKTTPKVCLLYCILPAAPDTSVTEYMEFMYQRTPINNAFKLYRGANAGRHIAQVANPELVSESFGKFDHFNLSWTGSQPLHVYDVRIRNWT